jgi:hypothetical protein
LGNEKKFKLWSAFEMEKKKSAKATQGSSSGMATR